MLTERTDVIGTAFLGLTVGCARCHNHKLEPISQRDYYRLQAYLAATDEHDIVLASADERKAWEVKADKVKREMKRVKADVQTATGAEKARLTDALEGLEDQMPSPLPTIPSTANNFSRADADSCLEARCLGKQGRSRWASSAQRVGGGRPGGIAGRRGRSAHTTRSLVDGVQSAADGPGAGQSCCGGNASVPGLVKTANDFGVHGERPSHPELLDWLAAKLVENDWQLKPLHRLLVLSNTYRQASQTAPPAEADRSDPEDRLLWRFNRRRLTAEEIRDAMLTVSGRLNLKMGGPSVMLPVDPELVQQLYKPLQWQVAESPTENDRRSIYLIAKRNLRLPFFETFDAPALLSSCARAVNRAPMLPQGVGNAERSILQ